MHRVSQGTSVAHTDLCKQGTLEDPTADSIVRDDAHIRSSKSKKGRFNVTPAGANTAPLNRTSLSTCAPHLCVICTSCIASGLSQFGFSFVRISSFLSESSR